MQAKKIEGRVINETNYSESSKILSVLTKDFGIISIMSKGCRKIKSKLRSVSTKLTYGNFLINYKENGISTLIDVDTIFVFKNIMLDINKISYSSYILELAKQNSDSDILDILIKSLNKIEEGLDPLIISLIAELKYLKYLGIDISLDCCSECGSTSDILTLSSDRGGYICKDCYNNEFIVTEKTIKVIRLLYHVDIDKLTKLNLSEKTIKEINTFLEEYYDKYSGLYLKSKKFLKILV